MRQLALIVLLGTAACGTTSSYSVSASVASPDLVYVGPGVYAVANADAPVFFADDHYWLYRDGFWYRSSYLTGGWHYAPAPYVLGRIDRPYAYHRYRSYRPERRVHVDVRDVRRPPYRAPVVRDHRYERDYSRPAPRATPRYERRDRVTPPPRPDRVTPRGHVNERDVRARDADVPVRAPRATPRSVPRERDHR